MEAVNRQRPITKWSLAFPIRLAETPVPTIQQIAQMLKDIMEVKKTACQCLQCDEPADPHRRGLCKYHYDCFYAAKISIKRSTKRETLEARQAFDDDMVTKFQILKPNPGRKPNKPNPFKIAITAKAS